MSAGSLVRFEHGRTGCRRQDMGKKRETHRVLSQINGGEVVVITESLADHFDVVGGEAIAGEIDCAQGHFGLRQHTHESIRRFRTQGVGRDI